MFLKCFCLFLLTDLSTDETQSESSDSDDHEYFEPPIEEEEEEDDHDDGIHLLLFIIFLATDFFRTHSTLRTCSNL